MDSSLGNIKFAIFFYKIRYIENGTLEKFLFNILVSFVYFVVICCLGVR